MAGAGQLETQTALAGCTRPISLTLLILAATLLLLVILPAMPRTHEQAFTEA
jgi:TctA family transporter